MQHTFRINSGSLNTHFAESVRTMFGGRDVKIVVEDVEKTTFPNQKELYETSLSVIAQFQDVTVDLDIDLSALANEINL